MSLTSLERALLGSECLTPNYFSGGPATDRPSQKVVVADKGAFSCGINTSDLGSPGGVAYVDPNIQVETTAIGLPGQYLQSNGSDEPTWVNVDRIVNNLTVNGTLTFPNFTPTCVLFLDPSKVVSDNAGFTWVSPTLQLGSQGVSIGNSAFLATQGVNIGNLSGGAVSQGPQTIAIGTTTGTTAQNSQAIAIGSNVGNVSQGSQAIAIGNMVGRSVQGSQAIAIGANSTNQSFQGNQAITVGRNCGSLSQGTSAIALGTACGTTGQGSFAIAVGSSVGGFNQGSNAIAFISTAGFTNQGQNAIAIGGTSGNTAQGTSAIAIGNTAGRGVQGSQAIAIGPSPGLASQGAQGIGLGSNCGSTQGALGIAIGSSTGQASQGIAGIAIGLTCSQTLQGTLAIGIGNAAGRTFQAARAISLGTGAGQTNQATSAIAIGNTAGASNQGANAIAICVSAGQYSQGANSIALGAFAALTAQPAGSICLNASAGIFTITQVGFFITPIRAVSSPGANPMTYLAATNEIVINTDKTFVIPHPLAESSQYLVHACLEGPESGGVYYMGKAEIQPGQTQTTVALPEYLTPEFVPMETRSFQLSAIGHFISLKVGLAKPLEFIVEAEFSAPDTQSLPFFWTLYGSRGLDFQAKLPKQQHLNGMGTPYTWL